MENSASIKEQVALLTLLLIYLTSWEERVHKDVPGVQRAWKGYPFDILDELAEKGYITQTRTAKSVYLTEEGMEKARRIQSVIAGVL